jgi:hypothetical protein
MTLTFWEKTDKIQNNTEPLFDASKEVVLEVNPKTTKYMMMSHCKKAGQKHSLKIANTFFENVTKCKYLGTTVTDKNCMNEEIKSRLNVRNVF